MYMYVTAQMWEGWARAIMLAHIQVEIENAFNSYWKDNNG